jgi:acyl-CoA thioesterase
MASDEDPLSITIRPASAADAHAASALVHESFTALVAADWEPGARDAFLAQSLPEPLAVKLGQCSFAAAAFEGDRMVGFLLMPAPSLLGMVFVRPADLRRGIGRLLWNHARRDVEARHPDVRTIELNSTPCALAFYRSIGFMPISREFAREGCRATRMANWLPGTQRDGDHVTTSDAPPRFIDHVGLEIVDHRAGEAVCRLRIGPKHLNTAGIVHGGVAYTLADTTMGVAVMGGLHAGERCSTMEIKISYFRPVRAGVMDCSAQVLHRGRSVVALEASVHADGTLVAKATGHYAVSQPKS